MKSEYTYYFIIAGVIVGTFSLIFPYLIGYFLIIFILGLVFLFSGTILSRSKVKANDPLVIERTLPFPTGIDNKNDSNTHVENIDINPFLHRRLTFALKTFVVILIPCLLITGFFLGFIAPVSSPDDTTTLDPLPLAVNQTSQFIAAPISGPIEVNGPPNSWDPQSGEYIWHYSNGKEVWLIPPQEPADINPDDYYFSGIDNSGQRSDTINVREFCCKPEVCGKNEISYQIRFEGEPDNISHHSILVSWFSTDGESIFFGFGHNGTLNAVPTMADYKIPKSFRDLVITTLSGNRYKI
jgi:hypothetical protein